MPATERPFSDLPPPHLYVDTDIIVNHLVETEPHHQRCQQFLTRLSEIGTTTIYLSSLSWLEFAHVVMRQDFRSRLSEDLRARFQLHRWADASVRKTYLETLIERFEELLGQFDLVEIAVGPEVRKEATRLVGEYNLDSHDAIHLASANRLGVFDLASLDAGFRRVEGLHLCNDLIHSG